MYAVQNVHLMQAIDAFSVSATLTVNGVNESWFDYDIAYEAQEGLVVKIMLKPCSVGTLTISARLNALWMMMRDWMFEE